MMNYITDIKAIHERNNGETIPLPFGQVDNGYIKGCLLYLCDGKHEGFAFHKESREEVFADAEESLNIVPAGYHLYYLRGNGIDPRNPSHVYWALMGEFVKE